MFGLVDHAVGAAALRRALPFRSAHRRAVTVEQCGRHLASACARLFGIQQIEKQKEAAALKAGRQIIWRWPVAGQAAQSSLKPADCGDPQRKDPIYWNGHSK